MSEQKDGGLGDASRLPRTTIPLADSLRLDVQLPETDNEVRKLAFTTADGIRKAVETEDLQPSEDSEAWTLGKIKPTDNVSGHYLGYYLLPPDEYEGDVAGCLIEVDRFGNTQPYIFYKSKGFSDGERMYDKYATNDAASLSFPRVPGEGIADDDGRQAITRLLLDIEARGVKLGDNKSIFQTGEEGLSQEVASMLESGNFPYTSKIAQEAIEEAMRAAEQKRAEAESKAAEREKKEAGDRKLRVDYLASVIGLNLYNISSGEANPVGSVEAAMAEMIERDGSGRDPKEETDLWRTYLTNLVNGQRITEHGITFNVERPRDPFEEFDSGTRGMVSYDDVTGEVEYTPENREHGKFTEVTAGLVSNEGKINTIDMSPLPDKDLWYDFDQPDDPEAQDNQDSEEQRMRSFEPQAVIRVTEVMDETGRTETYNLLFNAGDKRGFVVQCPSGKAYYWEFNKFDSGFMYPPGMRKPVIYLYPKKLTKAKVRIKLTDAKFTNTYPQMNGDTWDVIASPNGTLTVNGKKYKYLFWDGNPTREVEWDWSEGFSVHRDDVDTFLEQKMGELGLNFAEAQDFITYWAPMMKQNEWSLVSFQTERYEELAQLIVDPKPDTLIRVYMVFKKSGRQLDLPGQKLKKLKRKGFTVVEWGGSNLDEINMQAKDRFVLKEPTSIFLSA